MYVCMYACYRTSDMYLTHVHLANGHGYICICVDIYVCMHVLYMYVCVCLCVSVFVAIYYDMGIYLPLIAVMCAFFHKTIFMVYMC